MKQKYPLSWPDGWKRTPPASRSESRFRKSFGTVRKMLIEEVERLGARDLIISTNVPLRLDGLPYANGRDPADPGVAIYFTYHKKQMSFACDRYFLVGENMQAIALTINAIRGIERWGASDMLERAFRGFAALPDPGKNDWRSVLGVGNQPTIDEVEKQFRAQAQLLHPDHGGDAMAFNELVKARERARIELGNYD